MPGPLALLEQTLATIDLPAASEAELRSLTGQLNRGLARIEGYLTRVARELQTREAAGSGPAAGDVLRAGGSMSFDRAGQLAERAALAGVLPGLGANVESGAVGPENADHAARVVARLSRSERARLAARDAEIASRARCDSPETFKRFVNRAARQAGDPAPGGGPSAAERERDASSVALGRRANGRWWLSGDLDQERGAVINDLVNRRARELAGAGPVMPRHRAAALHDLVAHGGAGSGAGSGSEPNGGAAGSRMGIGYIVDARTLGGGAPGQSLAETWYGDPVDPASVRRLACDADLYAILVDEVGRPAGAGLTRRAATREQRLALRALYRTCPIDGATPFHRCEIHHVNVPFEHGGETDLPNLVPVSQDWHHRIHDRGWTLKMLPDRSLKLWRPDNTLCRIIPPPVPLTRQRE